MNGLLAEADLIQFIAMVVVLSLVAISTWIRKSIEKMQQRQGKPVDVGQAVRNQLDKYMRAAGQLPPEQPAAPPTAAPVPAAKAAPPPRPSWDRPVAEPAPAIVAPPKRQFRALANRQKTIRTVHHTSKFSPQDIKRAVVQAELLGPPIALRKDYRLF